MDLNQKIIVTGAAGLVGQNLIFALRQRGYKHIIAIDKNQHNLKILGKLNSGITIVDADLATDGKWQDYFTNDVAAVLMLHAQITGTDPDEFVRNNVLATDKVIEQIQQKEIPYTVAISSSVVHSVAEDDYTRTKTEQEQHVVSSGINCSILRPTLMFGWFDPKHLGWLSRFMEKAPIFPIPGNGKYMRQPLYCMDFCNVIISALEQQKTGVYDIVGQERIDYIDMIRLIKKVKKLKTVILPIPYSLFNILLKSYALFSKKPPFTSAQLKALTAGDDFTGVDIEQEFSVKPTPLIDAFTASYSDPQYSDIVLQRSNLSL